FSTFVLQYGALNEGQIALIENKATQLELQKEEYFSEAGKIPRQVGFILEGVMRGCYYNDKGEEITRCFMSENSLVVDYVSFEADAPASEYIQACTDCRLLAFSKQDWEALSGSVPGWDQIRDRMVRMCMFQKSRKAPVISQNATSRYLEFLEKHPFLVNRVPLAYIASYLGVTQQSLSRIRRNVR